MIDHGFSWSTQRAGIIGAERTAADVVLLSVCATAPVSLTVSEARRFATDLLAVIAAEPNPEPKKPDATMGGAKSKPAAPGPEAEIAELQARLADLASVDLSTLDAKAAHDHDALEHNLRRERDLLRQPTEQG